MTDNMKQIEELARHCCLPCENEYCGRCIEGFDPGWCTAALDTAEAIYNAGYRKQSGWISVDERLPTEEEYRDEYRELIPILVTEKDTIYPYRALYDGKTWGDGLTAITTITHWMPLPEPPKGE